MLEPENPEIRKGTVPPVDEVDLDAYRVRHGLSYLQLALLIGAKSARQARAWALGMERPSAETIDRIISATNGEVSVNALHRRRLAWERRRPRPIKNSERVTPAPTSTSRSPPPGDGSRRPADHR